MFIIYRCMHMCKLIALCTLKMCSLLHFSYTSVKLFEKQQNKTKIPHPQAVTTSKHPEDSSVGLWSWVGEHFIHH